MQRKPTFDDGHVIDLAQHALHPSPQLPSSHGHITATPHSYQNRNMIGVDALMH